ncbi:MAG: signal peptidase I [Candidatus Nomurabacteria bacterium]
MENNINEKLPTPTKSKLKEFVESGWDLIKFALIALVIVIPIRMWVAQPFVVSGESMFPTFDNGQYLIVDEISYLLGKEHRGDVVIFKYPGDTKRFFIKRLIGLPNETIVVTDKDVTIINKDHPEGFKLNEPYVNEKPFIQTGTYKTGDGEYFVMGDNRNRSSDSRTWAEPTALKLTNKLMVGRAYLRLLPINSISYLPGAHNQ